MLNIGIGRLFVVGLLVLHASLSHARELKVGVGSINYPPYYFEENGRLTGAAIEISQHIAARLSHTLVFEQYPWPRVQSYLRNGNIDLVILYFKTPARQEFAIYTDTPHIYDSSYLVKKKGAAISFDGDLASLGDYVFGSVRGYAYGDDYDNAHQLRKQKVGDERQLIRILLHGRVDLAVGSKAVISAHAKTAGVLDDLVFLRPAIEIAPAYFAFSKANADSTKLAQEFTAEIRKFVSTQEYQQILKKYSLQPDI